jgi:catechol 2,3-dioxygenase-like lactoylglutathione lyase family enzyme
MDYKLTQVSVDMLGVQDVTRSLAFYCDKPGLEV